MIRLAIGLLLLTSPALAQQQQNQPPEIQALQARIMQEVSGNLQCSALSIGLREENAKLKAEIESLKKDRPK